MANENFLGLMEMARLLDVAYWRILYAHRKGSLPWPARVVNTMAYSQEDFEHARTYFASRKKPKRAA